MLRPLLAALLALLLALPGSAEAARSDPVASAAARARAAFATGLKSAEGVLASATANLQKSLVSGATTSTAAASSYGAALAYFATSVKTLADAASESMAADVSALMAEQSDPTLGGALGGDGGALDAFTDAMQSALDGARRRALGRARRFAKTLRTAPLPARMDVVLPVWTFETRAAPIPNGPRAASPEPIRLWAAVATRIADGTVVVSASGGAPRSLTGKFDVRLLGDYIGRPLGPLLSAGGMNVTNDGTWNVTIPLNDPHLGEAVASGNYVIEFGVDPVDAGPPGGLQPSHHQHAAVIGIQ